MINKVLLVGRLARDLELKKTNSNISMCRFTLACGRRIKKDGADFIPCIAWRQGAEYLCNYAHKGDVVSVEGHITTSSYDNKGVKVYTIEVTCDAVRIISSKSSNEAKDLNEEYKFDATYPSEEDTNPNEEDTNGLPFY